MTTHRRRLLLVAVTLVQMALAAVYLETLTSRPDWSAVHAEDSRGYLRVARYLGGEPVPADEEQALRYRLFNPVVPALAALLRPLVGLEAAFLLVNGVLWILAALVFFEILAREGTGAAWIGAAAFTTSLPLIEWGLPVMVDTAAWLLVAVAWLVLRREDVTAGRAAVLGLVLGVAVLTKPTLLTLVAFAAIVLLLRRQWTATVLSVAIAGGLALAVYAAFGLRPEDFTSLGAPRHRGVVYVASAALVCFHWGWPFAVAGFRRLDAGRRRDLLVYFAAFFVPFLAFVHSPRLFFLAYPAVLIPAAVGLDRFCDGSAWHRRRGFVVAAYAVTSNVLAVVHLFVMRVLDLRGWGDLTAFVGQWLGG